MTLFIVAFIVLLATLGQDQQVDASCCGCCPCCCCKPIVIKLPPPPTKICPCCCCCKPCCCCCCKPCCCCCCKPCCCCCPCCCCGGGGGRKKRDVIDVMAKKLSDVLMPQQDAMPSLCNQQAFNPPALCNQIPALQQGPLCNGNLNQLNTIPGLGLNQMGPHSFHNLPIIHPNNNMPTNIHNLPNNNNNFNQNLINHNNFNGNNNGMDMMDCAGCGGSNCPGCGLNGNPNGCGGGGNAGNGCGGPQMNNNGNGNQGCHPADGCMMFGNCQPCGPGRKRRQAVFAKSRFLRAPEVRFNETGESAKKSESNGQKILVLRNNLELVLRQDKQKQSGSAPSTAIKF